MARGDWNTVWASFDQRRKAQANDTGEVDDGAEPDMFGKQAAE